MTVTFSRSLGPFHCSTQGITGHSRHLLLIAGNTVSTAPFPSNSLQTVLDQSVTNTFFWTEYEYRRLFGFQKSLNTEYQIQFGIEKIQIPNTEDYLVSKNSNTEYRRLFGIKKFKYRTRIVLFGLTVQIPNTKYRIVFNIRYSVISENRIIFGIRIRSKKRYSSHSGLTRFVKNC